MDTFEPDMPEFLSPQDIAAMLHCAVGTARDMIHTSGAPVFRTSEGRSGGILRVRKLEFLAWLDAQTQTKRASAS